VRHGPVTEQERWEEASGYSPSTLASNIAALICAACFARERGDETTARFLEQHADFLECHVEPWTVTTEGELVDGITRHFVRIKPVRAGDHSPDEDPNRGILAITNRPPGDQWEFAAKDIVDAGFLELVRYGIRKPDDPLIVDSLRVVDAVLKVDTPFGPCWRRYNHDGYGQRADTDLRRCSRGSPALLRQPNAVPLRSGSPIGKSLPSERGTRSESWPRPLFGSVGRETTGRR
jgi:glucoamylase